MRVPQLLRRPRHMCVSSHKTHQDVRLCAFVCESVSVKLHQHLIEARQAPRSTPHTCFSFYRDMAMVSVPTAEPAMACDSETSRPGGIEALNMKVGPVRRNLFGPVDHNQLQQDFERLFRMSVEAANKRWNFDFQNEKPGSGASVEWEELSCQDVPAFYRSCLVGAAPLPPRKRRTSSSSSYSSSGESSPGSSSPGTADQYLDVTRRGCYKVRRQAKRRQSAITGEATGSVGTAHGSVRK